MEQMFRLVFKQMTTAFLTSLATHDMIKLEGGVLPILTFDFCIVFLFPLVMWSKIKLFKLKYKLFKLKFKVL